MFVYFVIKSVCSQSSSLLLEWPTNSTPSKDIDKDMFKERILKSSLNVKLTPIEN